MTDLNMNHFEFKHDHNTTTSASQLPPPPPDPSISVLHLSTSSIPNLNSTIPPHPPPLPGGSNTNSGGFRRLNLSQIPQSSSKTTKPRRRHFCLELFLCTPSKLYLIATILLTILASFLLSYSLTSEYWEIMIYRQEKLKEFISTNESLSSHVTVSWLFGGKISKIYFEDRTPPNQSIYLLPVRSGVWISCIDINEVEYEELKLMGYENPHCVDHLQMNVGRPIEVRASWQHRMQNLGIACATVCLILLASAVFVGLFGVLRPQISAVLVTGVIYMLAALFAVFTLAIVHVKHKNRKDREPLDVWSRLVPESDDEFQTTRMIYHGWSLKLAWAGNSVCLLASIMWVVLSKIMRYNPNPLLANPL